MLVMLLSRIYHEILLVLLLKIFLTHNLVIGWGLSRERLKLLFRARIISLKGFNWLLVIAG